MAEAGQTAEDYGGDHRVPSDKGIYINVCTYISPPI